jgi:hypothetical protein
MRRATGSGNWAEVGRNQVSIMGIEVTLADAGTGLGNFLTYIQSPVVSIVLGLGVVGGVLAIFYGIAAVIKRSVGGATSSIGR